MTKVLIVGDTHDDASFVANIHKVARLEQVDTIIQLGDFGFGFSDNMLASIAAWLDRDENHEWYWIDGNHDEHNYIEQEIIGDQSWDHPIAHFHERMYYCPRGSIKMIGNKQCMFLGGAYSIDKDWRVPNVSWWHQELIRGTDVNRAIRNSNPATDLGGGVDWGQRIDVMLTHDAPPSEYLEADLAKFGYKVGPESHYNRQMLKQAVDEVRPKVLYHGHYHTRYSAPYTTKDGWQVQVEGIGANVTVKMGGQYLDPTARANHNYVIEEW